MRTSTQSLESRKKDGTGPVDDIILSLGAPVASDDKTFAIEVRSIFRNNAVLMFDEDMLDSTNRNHECAIARFVSFEKRIGHMFLPDAVAPNDNSLKRRVLRDHMKKTHDGSRATTRTTAATSGHALNGNLHDLERECEKTEKRTRPFDERRKEKKERKEQVALSTHDSRKRESKLNLKKT